VVVDTNDFISAALKEKRRRRRRFTSRQQATFCSNYNHRGRVVRHLGPTPPRAIDPARFSRLAARADGGGRAGEDHRADRRLPLSEGRQILELAVNSHADVLITGDSDLLALNPFRGAPIITPADFVQDDAR
jgi:hypothetical protein